MTDRRVPSPEPAKLIMKKQPVLMALAVLCAIFIFFLLLGVALNGLSGRSHRFPLGNKIAVVEVLGVIESSEAIIEDLKDYREDDNVKAVILRIDSPGGGVAPSQEIHNAVVKTAEKKPVVVSMGSLAASGGYYIAAPAHKIMANPGTLTGSIGVIMEFANYQELLDKIGWRNEVVKSGQHKDIGSPNRPMSEAERRILQALLDDVHDQFISAVVEGRKLDAKKVRELADGRIFTGRQAKAAGLVDELGGLEEAIDLAAELAGIEDPDVVYPTPESPKLIDYFIGEVSNRFLHRLREESAYQINYQWTGSR